MNQETTKGKVKQLFMKPGGFFGDDKKSITSVTILFQATKKYVALNLLNVSKSGTIECRLKECCSDIVELQAWICLLGIFYSRVILLEKPIYETLSESTKLQMYKSKTSKMNEEIYKVFWEFIGVDPLQRYWSKKSRQMQQSQVAVSKDEDDSINRFVLNIIEIEKKEIFDKYIATNEFVVWPKHASTIKVKKRRVWVRLTTRYVKVKNDHSFEYLQI